MVPPEEVQRELVRHWLAKAGEDLDVAEFLVSENRPYLSTVGFHAQQVGQAK